MAIHPIRVVGDPVLSTPTRPVPEFDDDLRTLVADMYETMAAANGVGLAANQIGVDLRVFVYDCPDDQGNRFKGVVVNPTLTTSERPEGMPDPDDDFEGCLSVPGETFPTGRADWAKVTGFDEQGEPVEVEGTGFFARCLQHETDHLSGVLYIDHLPRNRRRRVLREMEPFEWNAPVP